eukprot:3335103-Rhodomonas_salina.1
MRPHKAGKRPCVSTEAGALFFFFSPVSSQHPFLALSTSSILTLLFLRPPSDLGSRADGLMKGNDSLATTTARVGDMGPSVC